MNKSKHLIIGFMAVICLLANILNQDTGLDLDEFGDGC